MNKEIKSIQSALAKQFGEGTLVNIADVESYLEVKKIPTGVFIIDNLLNGGFPESSIITVYGEESCLSGDTFILYHIINKKGKLQNSKGGTLENLYKRFNKIQRKGKGNYQRGKTKNSDFFISSINEQNCIVKNKIVDVVNTGKKLTYKITTEKGHTLISTPEHKFYIGNNKFKCLEKLKLNDVVFIHNNIPNDLRFKVIQDKIIKINKYKVIETYDIKCSFPYNNYIANNLVVHNSGKSYISYKFSSLYTQQKKPIAIIDVEHCIDAKWLKKSGIDTNFVYLSQPSTFEKAIDICDTLVRSKQFSVVIFDSITSAIPKAHLDKSAFKEAMGKQAKLNTDLVQKLTSGLQPENLSDPNTYNKTIIILVGHVREKIGQLWGNPEILSGGRALKHHSHYILRFRRGDKISKSKDIIIGRQIKIKVEKAKYSPPLVQGIVDFYFNPPRIDNEKNIILYAIQLGIIIKKGGWYYYKKRKVQGQDTLIEILKNEPEVLSELKKEIFENKE